MVTKIDKGVYIGSDEFVKTSTVLWAAGVAASPLNKKLNVPLDRAGRVIVNKHCAIEGYPDAFVLGDQYFPRGRSLPGLAPVAIQRSLRGDSTEAKNQRQRSA